MTITRYGADPDQRVWNLDKEAAISRLDMILTCLHDYEVVTGLMVRPGSVDDIATLTECIILAATEGLYDQARFITRVAGTPT